MSQAEVGSACGVPQSVLSKWLRGTQTHQLSVLRAGAAAMRWHQDNKDRPTPCVQQNPQQQLFLQQLFLQEQQFLQEQMMHSLGPQQQQFLLQMMHSLGPQQQQSLLEMMHSLSPQQQQQFLHEQQQFLQQQFLQQQQQQQQQQQPGDRPNKRPRRD